MATETFAQSLLSDVVSLVIVGGFALIIISKFTKKSVKELLGDIKNMLGLGKEEDEDEGGK